MKTIFTLFFVTLMSTSVAAYDVPPDCPPLPDTADEARALAGEWFGKAEQQVEEHKDAEALNSFLCSIRMVEHPDTLFNAAQVARLAGETEMATDMLRRYLIIAPKGKMAEKVEIILQEMEEEAQDKEAAASSTEPTAPHTTSETTETVLQTPTESAPATRGGKEKLSPLSVSGYVALAVGGAGVVAGAVLQGLAGKYALSDADKENDYSKWLKLEEKMKNTQLGAYVGFIAGGIVAGAGIVMILLGKEENEDHTLSVVPMPGGVSFSGRF